MEVRSGCVTPALPKGVVSNTYVQSGYLGGRLDAMRVGRIFSLFSLLSVALNLSCGPSSKQVSAELSVGQQAYDKGDYAAALKVFRPLATRGNPIAQNYIGILFVEGKVVPQDYKEGI